MRGYEPRIPLRYFQIDPAASRVTHVMDVIVHQNSFDPKNERRQARSLVGKKTHDFRAIENVEFRLRL